MARFSAKKVAVKINRMNIKGVSSRTFNISKFTSKQKAAIKKARKQLRGLR